jgi:hypothetical protein
MAAHQARPFFCAVSSTFNTAISAVTQRFTGIRISGLNHLRFRYYVADA